MELSPSEIETLRTIVSEWVEHEEREVEATFGESGQVGTTEFLAVAQRLKAKGFKEVEQEPRLTISLQDHTRFTIESDGVISQYCVDNQIAGKSAVIMIKDRAGGESELRLPEYTAKVKVRREIALSDTDPRVKANMATWAQQVKFFRLIHRWTFVGHGCKFDLSMVRSTKKDDMGRWKNVRNFLDQPITQEVPIYEIEVELDRDDETNSNPSVALSNFVKAIGEVLRGLQKNSILIRKSIKEKVLTQYKELIGPNPFPGDDRVFRGNQPITLEVKNIQLDRTAGVENIRTGYNVTDKADGLRTLGYCNPKGELYLIDMALNVYRTGLKKAACRDTLVDGELITRNKEGEPVQMFMIFDIYYGVGKKQVWTDPFYLSYNPTFPGRYNAMKEWIVHWNNPPPEILVPGITPSAMTKVMLKTFLFGGETEDDIFTKCAQMLDRPVPYNTDGLILTANVSSLPAGFAVSNPVQFKWKPSKDNTIDFLIRAVKEKTPEGKDTAVDKVNTVIKPGSLETMRFKTYRLYVGSSADPAYDDPRTTVLYERQLPRGLPGRGKLGRKGLKMKPMLFNPKNIPDTMASICNLPVEAVEPGQEICRKEHTEEPLLDNSIVEMRYDVTAPAGWRWIPVRVRYDKTERFAAGTIERTLNSDTTAENVWESIHNPVTESMIRSGSSRPTEEEMAEDDRLRLEKAGVGLKYYERKASAHDLKITEPMRNFHNLFIKEQILFMSTIFQGSKVLDVSIGQGGDLERYRTRRVGFLLGVDIAGEGIRDPYNGAYRRYLDMIVRYAPSKGVDAWASIARGWKEQTLKMVMPAVFAIGDSSKGYLDGSAGATQEESDILRSTFGKVSPASKLPPFVEFFCKDQLKDGVDTVSCMFTLHYFFESKATWEGFLKNLNDTLKVGGFFIACFFDGDYVYQLIKDYSEGDMLDWENEETKTRVWSITKQYSLEDEQLPSDPERGFGNAIDVEFLSIGAKHREYLVSLPLLVDQLRSVGIDLASDSDIRSIPSLASIGINQSSMLFGETLELPAASGYTMSGDVKMYSEMNRWAIFRRYGTGPITSEESGSASPAYAPSTPVVGPGGLVPRSPELPPGGFVPRSPELPPGGFVPRSPELPPEAPAAWSEWASLSATIASGQLPPGGFAPRSPELPPGATPPYSPLYGPSSPVLVPGGAAAGRPASTAWNGVPLSGNVQEDAALRASSPPPPPPFASGASGAGAGVESLGAAVAQGQTGEQGEATAVIRGGGRTLARTLPVERATASGPKQKYDANQIYRFFGKAQLKDILDIKDPGAARWLTLTAPFPIEDTTVSPKVEYPSVNHFLAAMKYKLATDKPELAENLFSTHGTIHNKYLVARRQLISAHKGQKDAGQISEKEDSELLRQEGLDVQDAAEPKTIRRYKAQFDEGKWLSLKDDLLKTALEQRWKRDARFHKIVEAARAKNKYLLYYIGPSLISNFGGLYKEDGTIEGENLAGKIMMELAGFPGFT
jgi:hypothetical protein